jgi:heme/copper-type cytochrome/quinol oxidase subunit 1
VIVFVVCSVSFIVCVVLCAVFHLIVVLFCVMCVICVLCLTVVPLLPGKNPFAVKKNNNVSLWKVFRMEVLVSSAHA